jgi:hypothetical protein
MEILAEFERSLSADEVGIFVSILNNEENLGDITGLYVKGLSKSITNCDCY